MTEATRQTGAAHRGCGRVLAPLALAVLCVLGAAAVFLYERRAEHPITRAAEATAPATTGTAASKSTTGPLAQAPKPAITTALAGTAATSSAAAGSQAESGSVSRSITGSAPGPAAAAASGKAPSVDVVRVDRSGNLVMAGRADPGEKLTISNGRQTLGTVMTDEDGQWVFLPEAPLAPGAHQLVVAESGAAATGSNADTGTDQDTGHETKVLVGLPGKGAAAIVTAQGSKLESGPLVVLSQGNAPPRLLTPPAGSNPGPVGLDVVQYDDQGRIRFTGHAKAGSEVRLYVDNKPVGEAKANAEGQWTLTPQSNLAPGVHSLRTDEIAPDGRVMARSQVPFARATLADALKAGDAIVQPGDCLWTIARQTYGHGVEYTAIFDDNRSEIRNPNLIYPGQVFEMPSAQEAAHAPSPASLR